MIINDMMMTDLSSILNLFVARFRDIVYPYNTYNSLEPFQFETLVNFSAKTKPQVLLNFHPESKTFAHVEC